MTDTRNEPNKPLSDQNKGSGSDTVSAAKISAGTSVGNVGESPMPHAQPGASPTPGAGPAGTGTSAQSARLGSHTSKPLGGQTTGDRSRQDERPQDQAQSATEAVKEAAQSTGETVRHAAEQVQETAGQAYEQASEWARDKYERARSWASESMGQGPDQFGRGPRERAVQRFAETRKGVERFAAENPLMVGLVGLAAGLIVGALLPRTRREDATFGEWSDDLRDQGVRYARDMTQRGREFVEEAFTGNEDPRFSHHESEWRPEEPGIGRH